MNIARLLGIDYKRRLAEAAREAQLYALDCPGDELQPCPAGTKASRVVKLADEFVDAVKQHHAVREIWVDTVNASVVTVIDAPYDSDRLRDAIYDAELRVLVEFEPTFVQFRVRAELPDQLLAHTLWWSRTWQAQ